MSQTRLQSLLARRSSQTFSIGFSSGVGAGRRTQDHIDRNLELAACSLPASTIAGQRGMSARSNLGADLLSDVR